MFFDHLERVIYHWLILYSVLAEALELVFGSFPPGLFKVRVVEWWDSPLTLVNQFLSTDGCGLRT